MMVFPECSTVRVRHMVHEEDQIVRTRRQRLVDGSHWRRILADEPGAGSRRPIHADALLVGAVPLAPAVALRRLDARPVVRARDIGQRLRAERPRVVLVGRPRLEQDAC